MSQELKPIDIILFFQYKSQEHNKQDFPSWTTIVTCISHFMLVINSSTNMILYIFLNAAFRKHFMELVGVIGKWICCFRNKERASVSL